MTEVVQFYFDVMCPYAYQASLWIRSVRDQGGCEVEWRFFSLEEVNRVEGKKHPWEREWSYGWSLLRIAAHLRRQDPALVDAWYAACGHALHVQGRKVYLPDGTAAVAAELDLPTDTVDRSIEDPTTSDDVRMDHEWLATTKGGFGVPTLVFEDGAALFGPQIVHGPTGRDAMRLWDLVTGWRDFPDLYEIKRPKAGADLAHVATAFAPYLEARAWPTIENLAP